MSHRPLHRRTPSLSVVGIVVLAGFMSGCDGQSPGGPSPPPPPPPPPATTSPVIASVTPNRGSVGGGAFLTITGSGFHAQATITIGGEDVVAESRTGTILRVTVPSHAPGLVEVIVTNPDRQTARLNEAFEYVSADAFDFNGAWTGFALAHPAGATGQVPRHSDMDISFSIQNNRLVSVTCGFGEQPLAASALVESGGFSVTSNGAVVVSGRIVSESIAVGTIDTSACPGTRWNAARSPHGANRVSTR